MSIRIRCSCGKNYKVKAERAGRTLKCKACGAKLKARALEPEASEPEPKRRASRKKPGPEKRPASPRRAHLRQQKTSPGLLVAGVVGLLIALGVGSFFFIDGQSDSQADQAKKDAKASTNPAAEGEQKQKQGTPVGEKPVAPDPPGPVEVQARGRDWLARQVQGGRLRNVPQDQQVRAVGLAALVFSESGNTVRIGPYKTVLKPLVRVLQGHVRAGDLETPVEVEAFCVWALASQFAITLNPGLKASAKNAIARLVSYQEDDGGFGGLEATNLAVAALSWAKVARVPGWEPMRKARPYLERAKPETPTQRLGRLVALDRAGARRAQLHPEWKQAQTNPAQLDMLGLYWLVHAAFNMGDLAALRPAITQQILSRLHRTRDARGGSSVKGDVFETMLALRTLDMLTMSLARTGGTERMHMPRAAIMTLAGLKSVEEPKREHLIKALMHGPGMRWEKTTPEAIKVLNAHGTLSLKLLGEILNATRGPCADYDVKKKALTLLRQVAPETPKEETKPGEIPLVKIQRLRFHEAAIPHLVAFLQSNPPYDLVYDIYPFLKQRLQLKQYLQADTPWAERVAMFQQAKQAARTQ